MWRKKDGTPVLHWFPQPRCTPLMVMGAWKWIWESWLAFEGPRGGIFDNSKDAVSLAPLRTIPRAPKTTLLNESVRFFPLMIVLGRRSTRNGDITCLLLYSTRVQCCETGSQELGIFFFKTNDPSNTPPFWTNPYDDCEVIFTLMVDRSTV